MSEMKQFTHNEPCQKSVPIFPVRYTVMPKTFGEGIDGVSLGYPEMKHSSYTLRLVRQGYIYLYDAEKKGKGLHIWEARKDGKFQKIQAKQGSIVNISKSIYDKENKHYQLEDRTTPYVLARAEATEVYIGFSDALWTADLFKKIMADTDNMRTNLMTKVDVSAWDKKNPSEGTFSMGKNIENETGSYSNAFLEEFVEEYKDDEWGKKFSWSLYKNQKPVSQAEALKSIMDAYPTSDVKSIGVMLYDNIGLVVDQGGIINLQRKALEEFLKKDDKVHKKLISDCIEMVYKQSIAKNEEMNYEMFKYKEQRRVTLDRKLAKDKNIQDSFLLRTIPNQSIEKNKKIYGESEVESKEFENRLFKHHANDRMRTVNEEGRLAFLQSYEDEYKVLTQALMESKNDRWEHLNTFLLPTKPIDLGSSFANYDTVNKVAADLYGQAFSLCIRDIMNEPYTVESIVNKEHDLFATWMELPHGDDPLLNALEWGYDNKPDTMMSAIDALAKLPFSSIESENETLENKTRQTLDELESKQQQEETKLNEVEQERVRLEKIIDDELAKLNSKYSVGEISKNIATYVLTKPNRLNGAALTMANRKFNEFIYSSQPNKIDSLVNNILSTKRSYNKPIKKGDKTTNIEIKYLSPEEYEHKFAQAANLTSHKTQRFHFAGAKSTVPVQDSVYVLEADKPFVFSVVDNTDILDKQLNIRNLGQAVQGLTKSAESLSDNIEDLAKQSQKAEDVFHRDYNPFVTKLNKGFSPLVILANAVNLSRAIDSFESDNPIEYANLIAAMSGSIAALFYGIDSYQKKSTVQMVEGMKMKSISFNTLLSAENGMRAFGMVAAVSDAFTQGLKGYKAGNQNNKKAEESYYLSAVFLGVGGVMTLAASPIIILVGAIALIGGMIALSRADDLMWDDIDKWLGACVWRDTPEGKDFIPNNKPYGKDWEREYADFVRFFYNPRVEGSEWKVDDVTFRQDVLGRAKFQSMTHMLEFVVSFPLILNEEMKFGFNLRQGSTPEVKPRATKTLSSKKGEMATFEYESKIEHTSVKFKIYDIPSHLVLFHFVVEWEMPFKDETYKLRSFFTLDRINLIIDDGKSIKTEVIS